MGLRELLAQLAKVATQDANDIMENATEQKREMTEKEWEQWRAHIGELNEARDESKKWTGLG